MGKETLAYEKTQSEQSEGACQEEQDIKKDSKTKKSAKEKTQIKELESALQNEKDKFIRLFAEFENYKKRTTKERIELYKTAGQEVISALLPVLDDFDRALNQLSKSDDQVLFEGVLLINNKFRDSLLSKGLEPFEVAIGDVFNPDFHEAVTQIPASSEDLKGKIIDVLEKGYKLGEKIIRYPKVVIGQ